MLNIISTVVNGGSVTITTDSQVTNWVVKQNNVVIKKSPNTAISVQPTANGNFQHLIDSLSPGTYLITVSGPGGSADVTVIVK